MAELTPADYDDHEAALRLVNELPSQVSFVLDGAYDNAPNVPERCELGGETPSRSAKERVPIPKPLLPLNCALCVS